MRGIKNTSVGVGDLDKITLSCYVALVVIGWLMIYAVNYDPTAPYAFFDLSSNSGKQLFFIIACMVILFFIQMTDWAFWRTFAFPLYLFSLVLLAGTIVFGREVNGANAWYQLGGFSFQPSEIAKFSTCLAVAGYLSSTGVSLRDTKSRLYALGLFFIPVLIVLLQKDTGSALIFFSFLMVLFREGLPAGWYVLGFGTALMVILGLLFQAQDVSAVLIMIASARIIQQEQNNRYWWLAFFALLLVLFWWEDLSTWLVQTIISASGKNQAGAPADINPMWITAPPLAFLTAVFLKSYIRKNNLIQRRLQIIVLILTLGCSMVFLAGYAYSLMASHQQQRIRIWLHPSEAASDARGSAYNLLHSKMAIGSGGLLGKGPLKGNMTKLKYVPEQSTDFIFCTVGEEHGFVGVLGVVGLFFVLLYRITQLAERQRSNFSRIYAYGVAGVIFVHFIINIGMTMGLFPIIGIPLPFISYGGSSLIGFTLMIGVLLKLDSHRNLA